MAEENPTPARSERKQTKADKAAEKARAKAERPIWKKPWFWILGIILIVIVSSMAGGENGTETGGETTQQQDSGEDQPEVAGIGDAVQDGQFTFTVHSLECGETRLGNNRFTRAEAQGQFCIAEMTVENHGNEAQLMDASSQYLYVGERQYTADSDAILADKRAEAFFIEEINPGISVDGIVVWDIPADAEPDRLELHDSPFSDGIEVRL